VKNEGELGRKTYVPTNIKKKKRWEHNTSGEESFADEKICWYLVPVRLVPVHHAPETIAVYRMPTPRAAHRATIPPIMVTIGALIPMALPSDGFTTSSEP
jgi:hypothetical protein